MMLFASAMILAGNYAAQADDRHDSDNDKHDSDHSEFKQGSLLLSRSVYEGTAATVTVGQTLPPGCVAKLCKCPCCRRSLRRMAEQPRHR